MVRHRKLKIHFLLPLMILGFSLQAQTDLQRLKAEIDRMPNGPAKVMKLISASRSIANEQAGTAVVYAKQAITLAAGLQLLNERGQALSNLGTIYFTTKKYDLAVTQLEQTVVWKKANLPDDPRFKVDLAKDQRIIGNAYEEQRNWEKAYASYVKGVQFAKAGGSADEAAYAYNRMGEVQVKMENFQRAITHFNQAMPEARRSGNASLQRAVEKNLGTTVALLQNYLEKQQIQTQVEEVQVQIETVRDSLSQQLDSNKVLISTTNLLTMERKKDSAELRTKQLEIQNKDAEIAAREARENTFRIGVLGGGVFALTIILALFNRSRIRKKAKTALEKEKQKTEDLLFKILPSEIAKELIEHGKVKSREFEEATILFTDFKGFTAIAAKLSPDELVNELTYVFQAFDQIMDQYGLEKIKTIGDAYMAVSGVPNPRADHAIEAVAAALDMQAFMHRWKVEKEMRGEDPWELRIGINSGKVVAGVIGNKKFTYDVWGDAVNTAARMESAGEAWEVNISEETYHLIRGKASCIARGALPAKNKGNIPMYFVKQITASREVFTPKPSQPSPLWRN